VKTFVALGTVLAFTVLISSARAAERQVGSWDVIEEKDPITDQSRVLAVLDDPSEGAWFRIACERGKPGLSLSIPYEYQPGDRVAVALRVDEQPPLLAEWTPQIGSGIAWVGLSRGTYAMLATARKVALQISLKDKGTTVLVFPAVKTAEALAPLIKGCPIDATNEKRDAKPFDPTAPIFSDEETDQAKPPAEAVPSPSSKP
jgi:hypothetical protein